jgi:hypothetical protein
MLAHMKAKRRESPETTGLPEESSVAMAQAPHASGVHEADGEQSDTQVTCDVLCSLGASYDPGRLETESPDCSVSEMTHSTGEKRKSKGCPKQHQLPMFLSSKFHFQCHPLSIREVSFFLLLWRVGGQLESFLLSQWYFENGTVVPFSTLVLYRIYVNHGIS